MINVMIVDDQELIRTGFSLILGSDPGIRVVAEAGNGLVALELIEQLAAQGEVPHVVLMDVRMPGMDGIEATRRITRDHAQLRVLVLTTFDLDEYAIDAVAAGASGFLLKDARSAELISAIRDVAAGDAVMAPSVTQRLIERLRETSARGADAPAGDGKAMGEPIAELTEREREVFGLIAEGLSNTEIGQRLYLSESTVKTHVGRVLTKLGLRDRVHAVILAYELGLR